MKLREYNAFLVNNRDLLVDIFSKVSQDEIGEIEETKTRIMEWSTPKHQYYKQHKKIESNKIMEKNIFDDYGDNILISPNRTFTELTFEDWCERYDAVKWIYKNGDKGDEFFSLIYKKAFRRNNFYPDYIIQLQNGDIWIIEAKGGMTADGESNNIDKYAKHKFEALKDYAKNQPEIKWGFVRAVGTKLFFSNTEWEEDVTDRTVWKYIEDIIK